MNLNERLARGSDVASAAALGALTGRIDETLLDGVRTRRADRPSDPHAELKGRIHRACIDRLGSALYTIDSNEELATLVRNTVAEELVLDRTPLSRDERVRIERELTDDILGYGPLEAYLRDDTVTEIMVNGAYNIYVERDGKIEEVDDLAFTDDAHVLRIIDRIVSQVGRRIDESSPMVDARLPDGSRVNAIIPPLSLRGPILTIRKFAQDPYSLADLAVFGTLTTASAEFLAHCIRGKANVIISGGAGSGKTTILNALSAFVPGNERIITIEDAAELQLQQRHVVSLESRPANIEGQGEVRIRELVRNAVRMRPDRIIVGEVRGPETLDMLQAMNTGHEGSLTTIHANSPRDALHRLEMLTLMAGVELPLRAIREQIASAFDIAVHLVRLVDGSRRVSRVSEIVGMEGDVITMQDVFLARSDDDDSFARAGRMSLLGPLRPTGIVPSFLPKLATQGVEVPTRLFEAEALE